MAGVTPGGVRGVTGWTAFCANTVEGREGLSEGELAVCYFLPQVQYVEESVRTGFRRSENHIEDLLKKRKGSHCGTTQVRYMRVT